MKKRISHNKKDSLTNKKFKEKKTSENDIIQMMHLIINSKVYLFIAVVIAIIITLWSIKKQLQVPIVISSNDIQITLYLKSKQNNAFAMVDFLNKKHLSSCDLLDIKKYCNPLTFSIIEDKLNDIFQLSTIINKEYINKLNTKKWLKTLSNSNIPNKPRYSLQDLLIKMINFNINHFSTVPSKNIIKIDLQGLFYASAESVNNIVNIFVLEKTKDLYNALKNSTISEQDKKNVIDTFIVTTDHLRSAIIQLFEYRTNLDSYNSLKELAPASNYLSSLIQINKLKSINVSINNASLYPIQEISKKTPSLSGIIKSPNFIGILASAITLGLLFAFILRLFISIIIKINLKTIFIKKQQGKI